MEQENTTEKFEKGIEEINKGEKNKNNMQKPRNKQNFQNKPGGPHNFKKNNRYRKNRNNFQKENSNEFSASQQSNKVGSLDYKKANKFGDKDIKEQKYSESSKPLKPSPGSLGAMSELARKKLSEALNKKAESVVSISKQEGGWVAELEVIDEEYLPEQKLKSMNDIIGSYEVQLDDKGELISWNKKSSRKRGEIH